MAAASIDHLVALILFISVTALFIGLFNQTIQTGITYQQHKAIAQKCSDLLDNMLLSPGIPPNWSYSAGNPQGFGLQAIEFTQYELSPFSAMRLRSSDGTPVTYSMTGETYSNITMGFGQSLFVPYSQALDYATASKLIGVNGSYGFSLTLSPTVSVKVVQTQLNPLCLSISAYSQGFTLANAAINYCLITISGSEGGLPPVLGFKYGNATADNAGNSVLTLSDYNSATMSYAFIVSASVSGLVGIGYQQRSLYQQSYIVPLVESVQNETVILAHSWDITGTGQQAAPLSYNATSMVMSDDYSWQLMPFVNQTGNGCGLLNSGNGYDTLTLGAINPRIVIIPYSMSQAESGVVVMPWGLSSLSFPITFGGEVSDKSWVATDIRQVTIDRIAYHATLSVWSLSGYQVTG